MFNLVGYLKNLLGMKKPQYREVEVAEPLTEREQLYLNTIANPSCWIHKNMPEGFEGEMLKVSELEMLGIQRYAEYLRHGRTRKVLVEIK